MAHDDEQGSPLAVSAAADAPRPLFTRVAGGAVRARRTARRLGRRAVLAGAVTIGLLLGAGGEAAWAGALLPERGGSPNADRIASLYTVVLVLAALVFAGVAVALVFALVRYRERRSPVAAQIRGNTRLEIAWTVAAAGLIVFLAVFSILKLDAIEHPGPRRRKSRRRSGRRGRRRSRRVAHRRRRPPVRVDVQVSERRLLL